MKQEEIFSRLVDNAFDFLEKALAEFEKEPKYSVINFHAAVELFLKARLMCEHWSLVVSKPEAADWKRFLAGDFHSVTIRDAKNRLDAIAQDGISTPQFESFLRLADHRNRMVHFFHQGQYDTEKELQKIVGEQCQAWYHLHTLLSEQWVERFSKHQSRVKKFNKEMHKFRQFLRAKFGAIRGKIGELIKEGMLFHVCPSCGFKSLQEEGLEFDCLVCGLNASGVTFDCPGCSNKVTLIGEAWSTCKECGYKFRPEDVERHLTKGRYLSKDDMYDINVASCGECEGYETVVPVDSGWFCTQCFTRYDSEDIGQCGWCGGYSTGDLEDSFWRGCVACEGKSGWDSDKDD